MQTNLVSKINYQIPQANYSKKADNVAFGNSSNEVIEHVSLTDAEIGKTGDTLVNPTLRNKRNVAIKQAEALPSYVYRGLKGDPDYNFYEFLQTGKIPYYIGGAGLVAVVNAGANALNYSAKIGAKANAKSMAAGAVMYYLANMLSSTAVNLPVKLARGFDLNQPVKTVIETRPLSPNAEPPKKPEYHNVFESSEFTRWYLLYNASKNPEVNTKFDEIAKNMGVDTQSNDSDNIVKPTIQSMIKQSRAWKGIIAAFAVAVGVGIGQQKSIQQEFGTGLIKNIKSSLSKSTILEKAAGVKKAFVDTLAKPLVKATVDFWKGAGTSLISKHTGKAFILGLAGSVLAANYNLLKTSDKSKEKVVTVKEANT